MSSTVVLLDTSQPPHELGMVARHSVHEDDARADRRLKDAVRRYYALAELIETERGYVDDLRILVEVYLASLGAIAAPVPVPVSRAETHRTATSVIKETAGFGPSMSSFRPGSSAVSSQLHSYHYPPSSFPSSARVSRENPAPKPKSRVRPASVQVLSSLQPYTTRSRKDSGLDPRYTTALKEGLDREVKVRENSRQEEGVVGSTSVKGLHIRTQPVAAKSSNSPSSRSSVSRGAVRRASVDVVHTAAPPIYTRSYSASPESSPSLPSAFSPSIPSPVSPHPITVLPVPPHLSKRCQRVCATLSGADRELLARGAQDILILHGRIVRRIEEALGLVQQKVTERKRVSKGKERMVKAERLDKERDEVECEVEAAVRAVCGVFVTEAPNFQPYEAFCAQHNEALDTARRVKRAHASDWLEWERHCAESAARRGVDGPSAEDAAFDSPMPSPVTPMPVGRLASRNSLISAALVEADDAHSSTSTLRRRHSVDASSGSLRASVSATLKHTKSDPTPPTVGHCHAQGHGLDSPYNSLSVKRLSLAPENLYGAHESDALQADKERQRERNNRTKLSFTDYLIKPVQRVCKYPLLFEQLRARGRKDEAEKAPSPTTAAVIDANELFATVTSSVSAAHAPAEGETPRKRKGQAAFSLGGDSDEEDDEMNVVDLDSGERDTSDAIERAIRRMREVARTVDEAQRRREIENKSALIVERIVAGTPNNGSPVPRPIPLPDTNLTEDEKGSAEDGKVESRSDLGHGIGTSNGGSWQMKPPTRSLSFSSTFSRSRTRSGFGRSNSALLQHLQQLQRAAELGAATQIPGPPTRAFLTSLGACLLAGSLDVVVTHIEHAPQKMTRRDCGKRDSMLSLSGMTAMASNNSLATSSSFMPLPSRDPVKVKYLAAFLYVGGYIVLAKTPKMGVYEPRHWFALTDDTIEVVDVREDKALLPCSFHLVFHATGHRLELAAACQREKEIWLNAMHHARSLPPTWEYEPVPTLNISADLVNAQTARNSTDVPPVPSIPSTSNDAFTHDLNPSRMASNSTLRSEATMKPNRRQSVNGSSVRAFFMNNSENAASAPSTVLIRRVSASRRAQTDRYLSDVLSQPLLSARLHAKSHDEVLFRDPDPPQQGTGIGVGAMARNKLMARESVLVSKQCAPSICSTIASSIDQRSLIMDSASNITVQRPSLQPSQRKLVKKNPNRNSLSMLLTLPGSLTEDSSRDSGTSTPSSNGGFSPDSPLPSTSTTTSIDPLSQSQCSSTSTSAPTSSPLNELFPPEVRVVGVDNLPRGEDEELSEVLKHMDRPKRSRSLVNNFRDFFGSPRSVSSSPAPSMSSSRQTSVEESNDLPQETRQGNVLSRILKGASLRPRGRSVSDFIESTPTSSPSRSAPTTRVTPARPSFLSRSSSMLVMPRRKAESSAPVQAPAPSAETPEVLQTPTATTRLSSYSSRSSLASEARNQKSLGRAIKYRLFPGSLVPLTPIDSPHDWVS